MSYGVGALAGLADYGLETLGDTLGYGQVYRAIRKFGSRIHYKPWSYPISYSWGKDPSTPVSVGSDSDFSFSSPGWSPGGNFLMGSPADPVMLPGPDAKRPAFRSLDFGDSRAVVPYQRLPMYRRRHRGGFDYRRK